MLVHSFIRMGLICFPRCAVLGNDPERNVTALLNGVVPTPIASMLMWAKRVV